MPRQRSTLSKKVQTLHALNPRTHPLSIRDYVDYDYVEELTEAEKLWLARFTDNFHSADFRDNTLGFDEEQRRQRYRAKNGSNKDVLSHASGWNLLDRDIDVMGDGQDLETSTPKHLNTPQYKAALAQLRSAIDTKPRDEEAIEHLRKVLSEF